MFEIWIKILLLMCFFLHNSLAYNPSSNNSHSTSFSCHIHIWMPPHIFFFGHSKMSSLLLPQPVCCRYYRYLSSECCTTCTSILVKYFLLGLSYFFDRLHIFRIISPCTLFNLTFFVIEWSLDIDLGVT